VIPDMTTLGKSIGGGMSWRLRRQGGAEAQFDPPQPKLPAACGTFKNNVMTMVAAHRRLTEIYTPPPTKETQRNRQRDGRGQRHRRGHGNPRCASPARSMRTSQLPPPPVARGQGRQGTPTPI